MLGPAVGTTCFYNDRRIEGNYNFWTYFDRQSWGYKGWTQGNHVSARIPYSEKYQTFEDISHGSIDIEAVVTAYNNGLVYTDGDMHQFADTFNDKMAKHGIYHYRLADHKEWFEAGDCTPPTTPPTSPDEIIRCMPSPKRLVNGLGSHVHGVAAARWVALRPWSQTVYSYAHDLYNSWQYGLQFDPNVPAKKISVIHLYGIACLAASSGQLN